MYTSCIRRRICSRRLHQGVFTVVEFDTKTFFWQSWLHYKIREWRFICCHCSKMRLDRFRQDVGRNILLGYRNYRTRCPLCCLARTFSVISFIPMTRREHKAYVCRDCHGVAKCTTRGAGSNMSVPTRQLRGRFYARRRNAFLG
jgi:hypothetical protein